MIQSNSKVSIPPPRRGKEGEGGKGGEDGRMGGTIFFKFLEKTLVGK